MSDVFDLTGRVAVITGGAGLLGRKHAEAIAGQGGNPVLVDLAIADPDGKARQISATFGVDAKGFVVDITCPEEIQGLLDSVIAHYGRIDILINNAANNPKMEGSVVDRLVATGKLPPGNVGSGPRRGPDGGLRVQPRAGR